MDHYQTLMRQLEAPATRSDALRTIRLLGAGRLAQLVVRTWLRSPRLPLDRWAALLAGGWPAAELLADVVLHRLAPACRRDEAHAVLSRLADDGLLGAGQAGPIRDQLVAILPTTVAEVVAAVVADSTGSMQVDVVRRLARRPSPEAAAVLAAAIGHPEPRVRQAVVQALVLPQFAGLAPVAAMAAASQDAEAGPALPAARWLADRARSGDAQALQELAGLLTNTAATWGRRTALDVADELGLAAVSELADQADDSLQTAWLSDLACGRPGARRCALRLLQASGLSLAIHTTDCPSNEAVAQALIELADQRMVPALVERMVRGPRDVGDRIGAVLPRFGRATIEAALPYADDWSVQSLLERTAGRLGWTALEQAVADYPQRDPRRHELLTTIFRRRDPDALGLALEALAHDRLTRPLFATLGASGDSAATSALAARLETLPSWCMGEALQALEQLSALGDPRVGLALLNRLRLNHGVAGREMKVLAEHHAALATEPLLERLSSAPRSERAGMVDFLRLAPDQRCRAALRDLARRDEDKYVRECARKALRGEN